MDKKTTKVMVNGNPVGLVGLDNIFLDVKNSGLTDENLIKAKMLELVRRNNYIPNKSVDSYKEALYREYRIFLGEKVEPVVSGQLEIKILGPGCINCQKLVEETRNALMELDIAADVEHITDIKEIAQYGVMGSPALIVNGKVKVIGRVPHKEQIKKWIQEEVNKL
jgi:small redox-active disulfide protein 2